YRLVSGVEYPYCRRRFPIFTRGHIEPVHLRYEQGRSGPGDRRHMGYPYVRSAVDGEDIDKSLPATDIHTIAPSIDEQIVGILTGRDRAQQVPIRGAEYRQPGWLPEDSQQVAAGIQRQREIPTQGAGPPARHLLIRCTLYDRDLVVIRN